MAAHQAPPSLGFSRQEHWSGPPFPSPMHESEVKSESEVAQSCPTLSDPMDCSLPGSSVHGIFQTRVLDYYKHTEFPAYSKRLKILCRLKHTKKLYPWKGKLVVEGRKDDRAGRVR